MFLILSHMTRHLKHINWQSLEVLMVGYKTILYLLNPLHKIYSAAGKALSGPLLHLTYRELCQGPET